MITKQLNNYIGYGSSEEEALDSCKIISILKNTYNIRGFGDLEIRRNNLSPWKPKHNTLQIREVGYIQIKEDSICFDNTEIKVTNNLFEMLYKSFFNRLSMVDIAICSEEIEEFFSSNDIALPKMSDYQQVVPTDVYLLDESVCSYVILEDYNIVFFKDNKVAIKRLSEEYYWTCSYSDNNKNIVDIIYYISYVRGYEDIDKVIREVL